MVKCRIFLGSTNVKPIVRYYVVKNWNPLFPNSILRKKAKEGKSCQGFGLGIENDVSGLSFHCHFLSRRIHLSVVSFEPPPQPTRLCLGSYPITIIQTLTITIKRIGPFGKCLFFFSIESAKVYLFFFFLIRANMDINYSWVEVGWYICARVRAFINELTIHTFWNKRLRAELMYDMTLPITHFLIRPFVDTDEQPQKSEKMTKKKYNFLKSLFNSFIFTFVFVGRKTNYCFKKSLFFFLFILLAQKLFPDDSRKKVLPFQHSFMMPITVSKNKVTTTIQWLFYAGAKLFTLINKEFFWIITKMS